MKLTEMQNISGMKLPTVDTSHWLTYPVGRYLIKLPASIQIKGTPFTYNQGNVLSWEKDVKIENANTLLRKKYLELVKNEELHVEYTENFGTEGLGSLLASSYKKAPDTSGPSSIKYEMYVVNNKSVYDPNFKQCVYHFEYRTVGGFEPALSLESEEILNLQKKETEFVHLLANNIWPADMSLPLEIRNGVYFEGGFVYTPPEFHRIFAEISPFSPACEKSSITCSFPEYPHIIFSLSSTFHLGGESVSEIENEAENEPYANIIAEGSKDKFHTFTQKDIENYLFSSYTPNMHISMGNKNVVFASNEEGKLVESAPELDEPSFESNEEAIAFWNAIKENIRWRPDNWKVKAPDSPYYIVCDNKFPAVIPTQTEEICPELVMSIIETVVKLEGLYTGKGATQEQIREAENTLGLTFAPEYKTYLTQFGDVSAGSMELTGLGAGHIDVVNQTQYARDISETFPADLYVIYNLCIDGIVIVQSATGEIYETAPNYIPKKIFDSLAEFIEKEHLEEGMFFDDDDNDDEDDDNDGDSDNNNDNDDDGDADSKRSTVKSTQDPAFGLMTFKTFGWEKEDTLEIWGRIFNITIVAHDGDYEGITAEQQEAYLSIKDSFPKIIEDNFMMIVEFCKILAEDYEGEDDDDDKDYGDLAIEDVTSSLELTDIMFKEDGSWGILMECIYEEEHGVALYFEDGEMQIGQQNEFL